MLPLLERKHRAVAEATALLGWRLAPVWQRARAELAKHTRKPDQEWVRMLRLMETHPAAAVERAVAAALERHSPRLETVRLTPGSPARSSPAAASRVPTRFVQKYTVRARRGVELDAPPSPPDDQRSLPVRLARCGSARGRRRPGQGGASRVRSRSARPAARSTGLSMKCGFGGICGQMRNTERVHVPCY